MSRLAFSNHIPATTTITSLSHRLCNTRVMFHLQNQWTSLKSFYHRCACDLQVSFVGDPDSTSFYRRSTSIRLQRIQKVHSSARQYKMKQEEDSKSVEKPRVVIVGAGMAGVTAAHRLLQSSIAESRFELTVLEASHRVGGRICTAEIGGERVELGATWIHGIEGSPVYKIAEAIGALEADQSWEGKDGIRHSLKAGVRTEGGSDVDPSIYQPVVDLYRGLFREAQAVGELAAKKLVGVGVKSDDIAMDENDHCNSVGAFLRQGFDRFISQHENAVETGRPGNSIASAPSAFHLEKSKQDGDHGLSQLWDLRKVQEGVFTMLENLDRSVTGAGSLYDLNLNAFSEYKEFPGANISIAKGYSSVVQALANGLPEGTIQFGKHVVRIQWSGDGSQSFESPGAPVRVHCEGGLVIEAEHVIVTVSLGVLKGEIDREKISNTREDSDWSAGGNLPTSLEGSSCEKDEQLTAGLFEPALPNHKLKSIARLGFGVVDKVFVEFERPPEGQLHPLLFIFDKTAPLEPANAPQAVPHWARKLFSIYPTNLKSCVLQSWYTGQEALELESASDNEVVRGIVNTLSRFGEEPGHVNSILRSSWGTNPHFRGSYSYMAVDGSGADIDTLAEPLPNQTKDTVIKQDSVAPLQLLFAGEATDRHYYGTTHGAHRSGLREANRLLHHYGYSD